MTIDDHVPPSQRARRSGIRYQVSGVVQVSGL